MSTIANRILRRRQAMRRRASRIWLASVGRRIARMSGIRI